MRNRPLYVEIKRNTEERFLAEIPALELETVIQVCSLTSNETRAWEVYTNGIKNALIADKQAEIAQQQKAEIVDNLLDIGIDETEAKVAVNAIFEFRKEGAS